MVTLQDVAKRAGVSVMTVSNVVNDHPHVRLATREKVERALDELGYRPNLAARNLAKGRTGMIALALPHIDNPYFASLAHNLIAAAAEHDLTVLIEETGGDAAGERAAIETLAGRQIDGMVFSSEALTADDVALGRQPMVLLGERTAAGLSADHVAIDNVTAAADAVRHLLDTGRRDIVVVGAQPDRQGPAGPRLTGAVGALRVAGSELGEHTVQRVQEYTRRDAFDVTCRVLDQGVAVDGIFCFNDVLAAGALAALHDRGRQVPQQVGVVGFDDIDECRFAIPPLTSVAPDHRRLAEETVARLIQAIDRARGGTAAPTGHSGSDVVVPHRLVVRESTVAGAGRGIG